MIISEVDFIEITDVQSQEGYKLQLTFNDGKQHVVDLESFLKRSRHPEICKYLDHKLFQKFTFECGHVYWNDYDLSFSIDDLYEGSIT